jgi:hypothetical protein
MGKGSSNLVGAKQMGALNLALERLGRNGPVENAALLLDELNASLSAPGKHLKCGGKLTGQRE